MSAVAAPARAPASLMARAVLLGDRIDPSGFERPNAISTAPLAVRIDGGLAVVFRYGVVVSVGLSPATERQVIEQLLPRTQGRVLERDEESVAIVAGAPGEEGMGADGVVNLADLAPERLLVVADALAKSTALAKDERTMAEVFDTVEPWASELAQGRRPGSRGQMTRLIGRALLVQHRLAGRVEVHDKPDILWERPDLERLYAKLENEYELSERGAALERKLDLIGDTVTVMTDLIDTQRSLRLEIAVVALIVGEIALTLVQMLRG
jgi:uncharacterized Rmd1/YagE family protein